MAPKIAIQTMKGGPGSLKHDVNIVFTLTPKKTIGAPFNVVTFSGMAFSSDSEAYQTLSWDRDLYFATYKVQNQNGQKKFVLGNDCSDPVPVGMGSHLTPQSSFWEGVAGWSEAGFCSAVVSNHQVYPLSLVKCFTMRGIREPLPIGIWQPSGGPVRASPELFLQAFIVEDPNFGGITASVFNLKRPLFAEPLGCDAIPASSAWILTEDDDGAIRLEPTDVIDNPRQRKEARSLEQGLEALSNSFEAMNTKLDSLVRSLGDTRLRVLILEAAALTNGGELQEDSALSSNSSGSDRRQLAALARRVPTIQVKADRTETSVGILERKLPAVEAKAIRAENLFERTQNDIAALHLSLVTTQDEMAELDSRVAGVETRVFHLEGSRDQNGPPSPGVFPSQSH